MEDKMTSRLIKSMQEAIDYAKGDKDKCRETKIRVSEAFEVPETIDVQSLRKCLHMSQAEFAARFGFNLNTLRNWEHGRRHPDKAVLAYLCVISNNPQLVENSLRSKVCEVLN
jgi:putative transcriptional regulator